MNPVASRQLVADRRPSSRFAESSRWLLGYGSLFFAAWGLVNPSGMAHAMGDDPRYARALALRDGAIGVALLSAAARPALVARIVADASDAIRLASRSPRVATAAAAFAIWGTAVLAASSGRR